MNAIMTNAQNMESMKDEQLKEDSLQLITASSDFTAHEQTAAQLHVPSTEKLTFHSKS